MSVGLEDLVMGGTVDALRMSAALALDADRVAVALQSLPIAGRGILAAAVARAESGSLSALTPAVNSPKLRKVGRGADVVGALVYCHPHVVEALGVNSCGAAGVCARFPLCYHADPVGAAGRYRAVADARLQRTALYWFAPNVWAALLVREVGALVRLADRSGGYPAVRLNGLSDLDYVNWRPAVLDGASLFEWFGGVQWWDYTRVLPRVLRARPVNYHLTFSLDAGNDSQALQALGAGVSVAALMPTAGRGETWGGRVLVDGDQDDWRFLDPAGCVVGLKPKGPFRLSDAGLARYGYGPDAVAAMRRWVRDPRGGLEVERAPEWAGGLRGRGAPAALRAEGLGIPAGLAARSAVIEEAAL